MDFGIILVLISLILGILIGSFTKPTASWLKTTKPLSLLGLFLLIFLLGVKIGSAPQVTQHLGTIGYQGMIFALFTVLGSVIAGFMVSRYLPESLRK